MPSINQYSNRNNTTGGYQTSTNLDPITYNPRYLWLDEENYRKLEAKIDALGLTGSEKEKAMDKAYPQILPLVQKEIENSDRRKYINEANYEVSQIQDPNAKLVAQWKLTVTELAQQLKEKYNLDPKANDEEVFNSWINSIPNWWELLANYINNGDRELLYQWWLEEKIETPEPTENTVWGIQSIINKQSEVEWDTTLWKIWNWLDWVNLPWKVTEWVDSLTQKIPTLTYQKQVENLANKMNNLTEDEISNLYDKYVKMVRNGLDPEKWKDDDRNGYELFWDAITWDKDALDRINTLQIYDYSEAMPQDWIERNKRGSQLVDNLWLDLEVKDDDNLLVEWAKKLTNANKNLLNFIWWSWGWLENYAEWLGVGLQKLKDIKNENYVPQIRWQLENDDNAFTAYVADKTANFGEYMTDAPDTLMWKPVTPNAVKFLSNIPQSFLKMLTSKVRWKTNQADSKLWLLKMLFTEEWQQGLIDRYWSVENFANTINTDPSWAASDMLDIADKINLALNKTTWWLVERQNIGDVTDALSDDIVKWINVGLTNTSNWLKNKGWNRTSNFVDLSRKAMNTEPINETKKIIENPEQYAENLWKTAREVVDMVNPVNEDTKKRALERANRKIQNINRMTKKQQEKFKEMSNWMDQGEFQNQRWLKTLDDLSNHLIKNLDQVDTAMEWIEWRFKSPELDVVVDDVLKYATDTEDPRLWRMQKLYNKNAEWWLDMKEINEIKRFYERTNIFDYLQDTTKWKQRRKATNRDSKLREWQQQIAAEAWLDNLKELNKETQLTKYILDNASDWKAWVKWNNDISLTDWIVASWWGLDMNWIASLVGKKIYQSNRFQNKLVDVYNYIGWREQVPWPIVDMWKIEQQNQVRAEQQRLNEIEKAKLAVELAKVKNEQEFNAWLEKAQEMAWPALPYNPQYDNQAPIDYSTPTRVDSKGNAAQYWQINETYK